MARVSTEVWATSGSRPSAARRRPGLAGLLLAGGGQVDVPPSGEAVLEVPKALAVTGEYKSGHVRKPSRLPLLLGLGAGSPKFLDTTTLKFAMMRTKGAG